MNMRKLILVAGLIAGSLLPGKTFGQLTISEFLYSAVEDPEVKTFTEQVSYLEGKPYRTSPLQKLEVRMQNRELAYNQQELALRVNPANPWELRNKNLYFKDLQKSLSLERQVILKEALIERYYNVVMFMNLTELKAYNDSMQFNLEQQLAIQEKQYASSYFDADEYVKLKVEELDNTVEVEEVDYELADQRHLINRLYPRAYKSVLNWDLSSLITVNRIEQVVDSLTRLSVTSSLVQYEKQMIKVAQSEYNLERSNINLGFFQTEFDQRRVDQNRTPFNLSFGVTIPITNPNKGDMAKRKLEMIESQYDMEEAAHESETDKIIIQDKLSTLLIRYRNLEKRIFDLKKNNFAQTLSTIKGGDPLIVAQFNQRLGKLNDLLIKIKCNILLTYVDYLAFSDHLQQQPLVNFLSPSLEPIRP